MKRNKAKILALILIVAQLLLLIACVPIDDDPAQTTVGETTAATTTAATTTAKPVTTKAATTTAAATTAAATNAPAATTAAEKGCGSTVALSALALVPMLGAAVVFGKKRED